MGYHLAVCLFEGLPTPVTTSGEVGQVPRRKYIGEFATGAAYLPVVFPPRPGARSELNPHLVRGRHMQPLKKTRN